MKRNNDDNNDNTRSNKNAKARSKKIIRKCTTIIIMIENIITIKIMKVMEYIMILTRTTILMKYIIIPEKHMMLSVIMIMESIIVMILKIIINSIIINKHITINYNKIKSNDNDKKGYRLGVALNSTDQVLGSTPNVLLSRPTAKFGVVNTKCCNQHSLLIVL